MREYENGSAKHPAGELSSVTNPSFSIQADRLSFDMMVAGSAYATEAVVQFSDDDFCFHNAGTCPECGGDMTRSGACFSCPVCGFGSCGG